MTTNYHTAIAVGAAADAATFNTRYSDLDTQITAHNTEIVAARGGLASIDTRLDVSLNNNGTIRNDAVTAGTIADNAITAQSEINLGDAAAINGDAVRFNEYSVHTHPISGTYASFIQLYGDNKTGEGVDTAADPLPEYSRTDNNSNWIEVIRVALYKRASMDYIVLTGNKQNTSATLEGSIRLTVGGQTTTEAVAALGAAVFALGLDISALADDLTYTIVVDMRYAGGVGGATGQINLENVQIWGAATAPSPT